VNLARGECEERKGLLSQPKTKEVDEELELKQIWEEGREERKSSAQKGIIGAGKQAGGCWGLCSPSETRMVGVLWDSDGCCSGAPCKESPYKRGQSRKRTVLKKGESPKNLVKARQRTKSL